jgi:Mitochondrial K+-H+ exchange-related
MEVNTRIETGHFQKHSPQVPVALEMCCNLRCGECAMRYFCMRETHVYSNVQDQQKILMTCHNSSCYTFRVANWVLSQEDPTEAFFKAVPTEGKNNVLEVLYPVRLTVPHAKFFLNRLWMSSSSASVWMGSPCGASRMSVRACLQDSYQQVFVRRHLLFTARSREKYHKAWFRVTGIGIVPLLPLAITPLPNVPIYYLAYRVYSHRKAWQGAVAVLEHLQHLETYNPSAPDPDGAGQFHENATNLHASFDSSVTARLAFRPDSDLTTLCGSRERCETAARLSRMCAQGLKTLPVFYEKRQRCCQPQFAAPFGKTLALRKPVVPS